MYQNSPIICCVHAAVLKGNMDIRIVGFKIKKEGGSPMGKFRLDCKVLSSSADKTTVTGEMKGNSKIDLWHQRLAYVHLRQLLEGELSFVKFVYRERYIGSHILH